MQYYISIEKNKEVFDFYKPLWAARGVEGIMAETMTDGIQRAIEFEKSETDELFFIDIVADDIDFMPQLKLLSQETNAPILVATSQEHYTTKEHHDALNNGADYYAPYCGDPCGKPEDDIEGVLSAVKSANQRAGKRKSPNKLIIQGDVLLVADNYRAFINNIEVNLTKLETEIFRILLTDINENISHEQILEKIHGDYDKAMSANLYNAIKRLRKKIQDATGVDCIETVRNIGYRIITTKQDK